MQPPFIGCQHYDNSAGNTQDGVIMTLTNKLTPRLLKLLLDNKIVISEAQNRKRTSLMKKTTGNVDAKSYSELCKLFGRIKPRKPPKGYRKNITKEEITINETGEANMSFSDSIILKNSMWIETGRMTGGSRNILDLSKKGKLNGVTKFGSVSYFGLNPNKEHVKKDINVSYNGKLYISNKIFYTPGNSNWRLRLNGVTADGDKLTAISKPNFGFNGGFQDKILLFRNTDNTNYSLEILDKDELDKLIHNSSKWARGGSGNGRAYGII